MNDHASTIVPTDSPSVFAALESLITNSGARLAIVRPTNPPPGIAGFIFDVIEEDGLDLESEITSYPTSANTPIQDHISLAPETVTTCGTVAELIATEPELAYVADVNNPLPDIDALQPEWTPGMEEAIHAKEETAKAAQTMANDTQSLWGYYNARAPQGPRQTRQSMAVGYMYQLWRSRMLFTVETPWGFFTNMAIKRIASTQGETSKWTSQVQITFQKIHIAETMAIKPGLLAGRAYDQQSSVSQTGIGQATPTSAQASQFAQMTTATP